MKQETVTETLRCALYTRVSTQSQAEDEIPIQGQVEECERFAQGKGWQIVKTYSDAGYSGGTIDRPGFQDMYYDSKEKPKPFDIILTWRSNRLFRDVEARLAYSRMFRNAGVRIVTLHEPEFEGATGRLMETVLGAVDEHLRGQISEDTLRGLKLVARHGYSTGGRPPTGYRNERVATGKIKANGETEMRTKWVPDADMFPSVQKAFQMYAEGKTLAEIAESTKIVAAKNGLSTLLRNRAYLGERIYNTTRRASLQDKKYKRIKNNPDDFVIVHGTHDPIIDEDLFYRVQAILDARRPNRTGRQRTSPRHYVLSGLLWCGEHKEPYAGYTTGQNDYYACALRRKHGKAKCSCVLYKKDALECFIIDNLKTRVFTRERIRAGLDYLAEEKAKAEIQDNTERDAVTADILQTELELERFYNAIQKGIKPEALQKPINKLSDKKLSLNKRLIEIEEKRKQSVKIPKADEKTVTEVLAKVHQILDNTEPTELKAALGYFIDKIELRGQEIEISYSFDMSESLAYRWRPRGDLNP
jgi:site-specific DNA recombinase